MFAIIRKNGRQYRVSQGDTVKFDKMSSKPGAALEIEEVLAIEEQSGEFKFGSPVLKGVKVLGTVLKHERDKKIIVFKRKRRKTYRRKYGHRQSHTIVKIKSIGAKEVETKKSTSMKDASKKVVKEKNTSKSELKEKTETKKVSLEKNKKRVTKK